MGNGEANGNEHEMKIGIENQYANHGWDGDANANWKRNGNSHDRDIEDDGDNGDINGDHNAREGFLSIKFINKLFKRKCVWIFIKS